VPPVATWFDEARLDDAGVLETVDLRLRTLAESGARVRREAHEAAAATEEAIARGREEARPRAVIAAGPDSRLLRAVLEPWCPVPFVAWPNPGRPGWAGSLDLVVMLAPEGNDHGSASAVAEAVRRGAQVVVACPERSLVGEHAAGRHVTILPTVTGDQLATAVVMLDFLAHVHLGPRADAESVAESLDEVATDCSPHRDLAGNPAKMLAIAMADTNPLVCGSTVPAARGARRLREAPRRTSGRSAIAGDAEHLLPVIEATKPHDVFADPFSEEPADLRPLLLILDDGADDPVVREQAGELRAAADRHGVRVETVTTDADAEVARYASLVLTGLYAAEYLRVGLVED
jgi:hypothetical protein